MSATFYLTLLMTTGFALAMLSFLMMVVALVREEGYKDKAAEGLFMAVGLCCGLAGLFSPGGIGVVVILLLILSAPVILAGCHYLVTALKKEA